MMSPFSIEDALVRTAKANSKGMQTDLLPRRYLRFYHLSGTPAGVKVEHEYEFVDEVREVIALDDSETGSFATDEDWEDIDGIFASPAVLTTSLTISYSAAVKLGRAEGPSAGNGESCQNSHETGIRLD